MTRLGDVNRDVFKPLCRQVGIPVGTLYAFRHGRVSKMQKQGVNEKLFLAEVGHTPTAHDPALHTLHAGAAPCYRRKTGKLE